MALRKKHEVLEEPQDYEIERRETPRYNPDPEAGLRTCCWRWRWRIRL